MNRYLEFISRGLHQIQRTFFPDLEHEAGPIPATLIHLTYILETVHSQKIPLPERCWTGRPPKSRRGIFNAFIAKAFLKMPTTLHLVEGFTETWIRYKLHLFYITKPRRRRGFVIGSIEICSLMKSRFGLGVQAFVSRRSSRFQGFLNIVPVGENIVADRNRGVESRDGNEKKTDLLQDIQRNQPDRIGDH
jgi:hypothetical protein